MASRGGSLGWCLMKAHRAARTRPAWLSGWRFAWTTHPTGRRFIPSMSGGVHAWPARRAKPPSARSAGPSRWHRLPHTRDEVVTETDALFARARRGDRGAFAEWAGRVERPVRLSVMRYARAVDLEVVVQECLLRMWLLATSPRELEGENASLRMAIAVARNVAREELRRTRRDVHAPLEDV